MKIGYDAKRIFHNATGLGNYCRDIIRILSSNHAEHQYVLYNPKPGKIQRLKVDGKIIIEQRPSRYIWRVLNSLWRQGPILKQVKADGINLYHGLSGELPRGIESAQVKSVVTIHDLIFVTHPELYRAIDRKIYLNKFKYACTQADVVIAISDYTKNQIVQHLGTPEEKIEVICQTCHPIFKPDDSSEKNQLIGAGQLKYQLPDDFLLMVGTVERRKNALALIKAIHDSSYHAVIVGRKTAYQKEIDTYINQHEMGHRVHFIENIELADLAAIYRQAKIMVYTSLVEGFGIPIIEALYTSTPVICHEEGVFPEAAGKGSRYVDMRNPPAIREAIDDIWNNPLLQEQMIKDGLNHVKQFDDEVIATGIMNIYKSLIPA